MRELMSLNSLRETVYCSDCLDDLISVAVIATKMQLK